MHTMDIRHPSPSPRGDCLRPGNYRQRSNSFPIVEALGCSTPEAELILREGRAAVRSRQARRRRRRIGGIETLRPGDHLQYLDGESAVSDNSSEGSPSTSYGRSRSHSRSLSDGTDRSTCTVVAPIQPPVDEPTPSIIVQRPLGDYSANLAKFIQRQLNSIPSYNPTRSSISPSSCPDLSLPSRTPPHSPTKWPRRPSDAPQSIAIPPLRPPLKSTFSAWSSTDEDTDDEMPPLPGADAPDQNSKADSYTPSVLGYYENSSSFLLSSTPLEEEDRPDTAKGLSSPSQSELPLSSAARQSPSSNHGDYPSSALSTHSQLMSSSAPSVSSASTVSYFESKRPISLAPQVPPQLRDRIIAATTPPHLPRKVVHARSPFEGGALANLHAITVDDNLRRVLVDGMSFDMSRDFTMPDEGLGRVPTPC